MMRDRATWTTDVLVHSCTMMRTSKSVKSVGDDERSGASHSSAQRAHGRATRARDDFEYRYYDIQNDPIARAAFDAGGLSVTPIRRSKRVETGRVDAIVTDSRAFCRPHDDDDMRTNKRCENPHASIARIVALGTHPDARARPVLRSSTRAQSGSTSCASRGNVWTLGGVGVLGAGASVEKTYVFASHDTHARVRVTIDVIATGHWTSNARFTATRCLAFVVDHSSPLLHLVLTTSVNDRVGHQAYFGLTRARVEPISS
ncbi:hypothetical protein BE221DRAFT_164447 [Ostreococcus tauri]|uniref:Uncharacterized protein n=1 Tax=Ostreococcus tauri TaxID=70448 RepID=A0A1Y5I3D8_OSTTA|nr:hypothetical protein BE221DRAFT_164447 [Ostreococcus tauri]